MQEYRPSLPARDDTFFGVCQAIGEDFGFHPNWLRVGFALALFFTPLGALAAYVGAGLLVAASRLIVREPRVPLPQPASAETQAEEAARAEAEPLPIAA